MINNLLWHLKHSFLSELSYLSLQVIFEAITGQETWGSISVDDVKVSPGSCPLPVTCNFDEKDLCLWTQSDNDRANWLLYNKLNDLGDFSNGE